MSNNHPRRRSERTTRNDLNEVSKFVYEIGQLNRVPRSGWSLIGVSNPESVAEHSFRVAVIGYILAEMEEADAGRTVVMCLFHDAHESRINDLHRVARRYLPWNGIEGHITSDQVSRLPEQIASRVVTLLSDYETTTSLEAHLAHDADQLECLAQAREYQAQGYTDLEDWLVSCKEALYSESAKRLAKDLISLEPSAWWRGLKAFKPSDRSGTTK